MAYEFRIGKMLLPVPPEKLTVKVNNGNKTYSLMNEGEVNALKAPGLTEIEFDLLLPNIKYPFAAYDGSFHRAKYYLDKLEKLKAKKKRFQFIVYRGLPNGKVFFTTNITCSLEEYSILEDAGANGTDVLVSVSLKQYRPYGVKKCKARHKKKLSLQKLRDRKYFNLKKSTEEYRLAPDGRDGGGKGKEELTELGSAGADRETAEIIIKKTITLYNLARKIYGDGRFYIDIAQANYSQDPEARRRLKGGGALAGQTGDPERSMEGAKFNLWKKSKKLKKGMRIIIPLTYYR